MLGVFRVHTRDGGDGTGDGFGLADAAGLDDDVVELLRLDQIRQLVHQIHFQRAAYTSVLERHKAVVFLSHHPTLLDEGGIDVHLSYVIDYHRKLNAFAVRQNMVHQSCLSASQVARQQ